MTELNDAEHELILNNPRADRFIAEQAVNRAVAGGMSRAEAERLYGYREEPELEMEDMNRITKEVVLGLPPATPDTPKMEAFRAEVAEDVERTLAENPDAVFDLPRE